MSESDSRGAAVTFPPPLIFLILIAGGAALDAYVLSFAQLLDGRFIGLGWVSVALAFVLFKLSIQQFRDTGQDPQPWLESPQLIVRGVYRYTRNPMYVGMAFLQLGVGLNTSNVWTIGFVPIGILLVYMIAVRPEESYLEATFGDAYLAYTKTVSRWV